MRTARLAGAAFWLLTALLAALVVTTRLAPAVAGVSAVSVSGTSMTGRYDIGSLVYVDPRVEPQVGSVVTFDHGGRLWTHQIIARTHSIASFDELRWQTKGTTQEAADPFVLDPKDIRGVVVGKIDYLGYINQWMMSAPAWITVLLLGGLLLMYSQPPQNAVQRRLATYVTPPKKRRSRNRTQQRLYDLFPI